MKGPLQGVKTAAKRLCLRQSARAVWAESFTLADELVVTDLSMG